MIANSLRRAAAFAGIAIALPLLAAPPADVADAMRWRLVGPFRAGWSTMAEGIPDQPNTFYFGAAGGGVWKSDDAGAT